MKRSSCEPCRARKLRCSRDGPACKTCKNRGLTGKECIYVCMPRMPTKQQSSASSAPQTHLHARNKDLEAQPQQWRDVQARTITGRVTPPPTAPTTSKLFHQHMNYTISPIVDHAGALHASQVGYVRYISPTSWQWVVANSPWTKYLQNSILNTNDEDEQQMPLICKEHASDAELLGMLPPVEYCNTLKELYFRVVSPTFHILNDSIFEAEYQHFCQHPHTMSTSWLALLFALIATSVSALEDEDPILFAQGRERTKSHNVKLLYTRYHSAALQCLARDGFMTRHTINSLQALVLINFASLHRGICCSTLIGLTRYVAISMGCHIDPERFFLSPIECEERRRVWAGLLILDTAQNNLFGSLDPQQYTQDTNLPADIDDDNLLTATSIPRSSDVSLPSCTAPLTQTTYLFLCCHLYYTSSRVCELLFSEKRPRYYLATIEAEIQAIRDHCDARYGQEFVPIQQQANKNILHAQIQQQLLLLHRPALIRFLRGEKNAETYAAREKSIASANTALSIFRDLFENPKFVSHKWWTGGLGSLYAFHALVVLAVLLHHSESVSEFERIKVIVSEVVQIFATLSVRSFFCRKTVPIVLKIINVRSVPSDQNQEHQSSQFEP